MDNIRYTIKDIAKQLGISPSTVSRALKDHPDISEKTKKLVGELARKLKYQPNPIALSLRSKHSKTIGILVPEIIHYFFSTIISGIEEVLNEAGYNAMICQSNESYEKEVENTRTLFSSRIDGLIVSVTKETTNSDHFKELIDCDIPAVFFDRICQEIPADKIIVDDHDGALKAVNYLIENGCKKIFHYAGPQNRLIGKNRKNGYLKALEDNSIPKNKEYIFNCDNFQDAFDLTTELIIDKNIPDAIFTVNDLTAIGAIKAIKKQGLIVPDDISVVGFGDSQSAWVSDPALTTIRQPGSEIGRTAATLLLNRLKTSSDSYTPHIKVLKTDLVIRESTKKI